MFPMRKAGYGEEFVWKYMGTRNTERKKFRRKRKGNKKKMNKLDMMC